MTEEINKQEQAKRQSGLWLDLAAGMVLVVGLITLNGCSSTGTSTGKIYKIDELVTTALADKDAWTGKEVTVTGYVGETSGSNPVIVTMTIDRDTVDKSITCSLQGVKSADVFGKNIEVKGKIKSLTPTGESKKVQLEPCEVKK